MLGMPHHSHERVPLCHPGLRHTHGGEGHRHLQTLLSQTRKRASTRSAALYSPRANAMGQTKNWYTSRFVRVILAQGPC